MAKETVVHPTMEYGSVTKKNKSYRQVLGWIQNTLSEKEVSNSRSLYTIFKNLEKPE